MPIIIPSTKTYNIENNIVVSNNTDCINISENVETTEQTEFTVLPNNSLQSGGITDIPSTYDYGLQYEDDIKFTGELRWRKKSNVEVKSKRQIVNSSSITAEIKYTVLADCDIDSSNYDTKFDATSHCQMYTSFNDEGDFSSIIASMKRIPLNENDNDANVKQWQKDTIGTCGFIKKSETPLSIVCDVYVLWGISVYWQSYDENKTEFDRTVFGVDYNQTISFTGSTLALEESAITYGSGLKKTNYPNNELIKTNTKYDTNGVNKDIGLYISENIINNWANGKQALKIRCSIGNYYDEIGTLKITTKSGTTQMFFKIDDKVIPYVYSSRGEVPVASYLDGTPKVFAVTGVSFLNDGAVWQELDLLEEAQVS